MKKDNNLSLSQKKRINRDMVFHFVIITLSILLGVLLIASKWYDDYLKASVRNDITYIAEVEVISKGSEQVKKTSSNLNLMTNIVETKTYEVTEYYLIVKYENSLDGTAKVRVRNSTYDKYMVGDVVEVSEVYYVGEGKNYLETYELKVVKE